MKKENNAVVKKGCHSQQRRSGMTTCLNISKTLINNKGCCLRPLREKVGEARMRGKSAFPARFVIPQACNAGYSGRSAFTLIELLVVILIIGILAAIALPQYQKAVLKSRYSALMPIGKALANGNELYYMEHGSYAQAPADLVVQGKDAYPGGTNTSLGEGTDYAYVAVSNSALPNNYVVYQKHSTNYPGEIHCEAEQDNSKARWLCETGLNGTHINGSREAGYDTYVLEGNGHGVLPLRLLECSRDSDIKETCRVIVNADGRSETLEICLDTADEKGCRTVTLDIDENVSKTEDVWVCKERNREGECTAYQKHFNDGIHDISEECELTSSDGETCLIGKKEETVYNPDGSYIHTLDESRCDGHDNCAAERGTHELTETYNADGKLIHTTDKQSFCNHWAGDGTTCLNGYNHVIDDDVAAGTPPGATITHYGCSTYSADGKSCLTGSTTTLYENPAEGTRTETTTSTQCKQLSDDKNSCVSGTDVITQNNGSSRLEASREVSNGVSVSGFVWHTDAATGMESVIKWYCVDEECSSYDMGAWDSDSKGNRSNEVAKQCDSVNWQTGECVNARLLW